MRMIRCDETVMFKCPGCGHSHMVYVDKVPGHSHAIWDFNGDYDRPTLVPSILITARQWVPPVTPENLEIWRHHPWEQRQIQTVCHSFVTEGHIQFLSDCTHRLAGQTVPLPEITI